MNKSIIVLFCQIGESPPTDGDAETQARSEAFGWRAAAARSQRGRAAPRARAGRARARARRRRRRALYVHFVLYFFIILTFTLRIYKQLHTLPITVYTGRTIYLICIFYTDIDLYSNKSNID